MQCDDKLKQQIQRHFGAFDVIENKVDDAHHAAVAVVVLEVGFGADLPGLPVHSSWQSDAGLLLTRRSLQLKNHPGQWAFPGGRLEPGESVVQTALRELHEEVGVKLDQHQVLGVLDDFVTRSGFVMTPVVVWGGAGLEAIPNPEEVASVHRIPCNEFLRADAPWLVDQAGCDEQVLRMPVGDDYIAAPTAALIYQFREVCLLGQTTRVAHFEQPHFAWR